MFAIEADRVEYTNKVQLCVSEMLGEMTFIDPKRRELQSSDWDSIVERKFILMA